VTCPSTDLCVADDTAADIFTSTNPGAAGTRWVATPPRRVSRLPLSADIWCVGAVMCLGVEEAGSPIETDDTTRGSSATWHTEQYLDTGNGSSGYATDVTCASLRLCLIGGTSDLA
jgi:hypothetical protein